MDKKVMRFLMFCAYVVFAISASPCIVSAYAENTVAENSEENVDQESGRETVDASVQESEEDGQGLYSYAEPVVEEVSYTWIIVKTLVVLALLVLGFFLFFKYIGGKGTLMGGGRTILNVVGVLPLGQNKMIQVIEVGSKLLILGVTDSNINLIQEITEKDEIDAIKLQSSAAVVEGKQDFQGFLKDNISSLVSRVSGKQSQHNHRGMGADRSGHGYEKNEPRRRNDEDPGVVNERNRPLRQNRYDDDRLEYLRRQKNRLKNLGSFYDE